MILDWTERFLRWLVRLVGGLVLIQFSLLVLAMASIGGGLAALTSGMDSNPTFLIALIGSLIGWQLARSRLNGWWSALIAVLCGVITLFLTTGRLYLPLGVLVAALYTGWRQLLHGQIADTGLIADAWRVLGEDLGGVLTRVASWFRIVGSDAVANDPLVIGLLWGIMLWLLAIWAAWMIRRRSATLIGLLPGVALLAYDFFYTNSRAGLVWLLLLGVALVALQAVQNYASARRRWQAAKLDQVELEPGLAFAVLSLVVALVIVGALTPSISIKKMAESIDRMIERHNDSLAESLGMQSTPQSPSGQVYSILNSHSVGAGPDLSPQVVMTIVVDGYESIPEEAIMQGETAESPVRYYWRSQSFDRYTGRGWTASSIRTTEVEANQAIHPDEQVMPEDFLLVTQHVTRRLQGEAVLATGELLMLDQVATITWNGPDDFTGASTPANTYTAESRAPLATVETLRQAGLEYPEEIRQDYLQLPDDLPDRVRNLAFEISFSQTTPYDQVAAIETYLRKYPYTLHVPAPPTGRDAADYFLFDLQRGYCDYYATTMVVLVRAAGIPARFVVGYARGSYDRTHEYFIVREKNAHAWVEVYFPGIGWIEFEPTASQPGITRLHDPNAPVEAGQLPAVPTAPETPVFVRLWRRLDIPTGWLAAAGIALLLALLIPLEGWLLHLQRPDRALDVIQHRLYRLGHRWNLPRAGSLTPYEFTRALSTRLETFAGTQRLSAIIAAICRDMDWLTGIYVRSLYAGRFPSSFESRRAVHTWLRLKRRLWGLRLRFWLKT